MKPIPHEIGQKQLRLFVLMLMILNIGIFGCNKSESRANGGGGGGRSGSTDIALTFSSVASASLEPSETADTNCTEVSFLISRGETPIPEITVAFEIVKSAAALLEGEDGTLSAASAATDEAGVVKTQYCAGSNSLELTVKATAKGPADEALEASSDKITVGVAYDAETAADALTANAVATAEIFTKSSLVNNCINISFNTLKDKKAIAGQMVRFSISPAGSEPLGVLSPAEIESDEDGVASTAFCSADTESTITIVAKSGPITANSSEIKIVVKPEYEFKYARSLNPMEEGSTVVELNLLDAGPNDCTVLFFSINKSGNPHTGATVRFKTQLDYPKKAKLAVKEAEGLTDTDASTGKSFGYNDVTSNTDGEFPVPVCAGVEIGSLLITGMFTDEEGRKFEAKSPVVSFSTGVTNYANMSLTFDPDNARTLKGFFETNTTEEHSFSLKLGTTQDGDPITTDPVVIQAEIGKLQIANGGRPSDDGTVTFSMLPLNLGAYRPYMVNDYSAYPEAITRCSVLALQQKGIDDGGPGNEVNYRDLRMNWRSTLTYAIRGQEQFYDLDADGTYDEGGFGFWDKNQDGFYYSSSFKTPGGSCAPRAANCDDALTTDGTTPSSGIVRPNIPYASNVEWFIDLPSPFVDVNENGKMDTNIDKLIGNEFIPSNGKRDNDTMVWRSTVLPIYMGTSSTSVRNAKVPTDLSLDDSDATFKIGESYYDTYLNGLGLHGAVAPTLFSSIAFGNDENATSSAQYFFAKGVCGNALPGNTELEVTFTDISAMTTGTRDFAAHFYQQPGDEVLEPARRLLKDSGGSTAKINYNIPEHPSEAFNYPMKFYIKSSACLNECAGHVKAAGAGVVCSALSATYNLKVDTDTFSNAVSVGAVATCTCYDDAYLDGGACTCPIGTVGYTVSEKCEYPPVPVSVVPNVGSAAGSTPITITGSYFMTAGITTVTVGGSACTPVSVVSATSITCTVPAGGAAADVQDIVISNPDGQSGILSGAFTRN